MINKVIAKAVRNQLLRTEKTIDIFIENLNDSNDKQYLIELVKHDIDLLIQLIESANESN